MDDKSRADAAREWLEAQEPNPELSHEQARKLEELIGHAGFGGLLAILGAERQGCYVAISLLNLEEPMARRQATVLQGKIEGIEAIRTILLEQLALTDPAEKEN